MLICTCAHFISCSDPASTGIIKAEKIPGNNTAGSLSWVNPEGHFDKITIAWSESSHFPFQCVINSNFH
jgi:hypothetical protein